MNLYVFGNPVLQIDSLPIRLVPELEKTFPKINFLIRDPNELDLPQEKVWWILDTVVGLKNVRFISIEEIKKTKSRVTVHDFDLAAHLLLVLKLKPEQKIKIIGVPSNLSLEQAAEGVAKLLSSSI